MYSARPITKTVFHRLVCVTQPASHQRNQSVFHRRCLRARRLRIDLIESTDCPNIKYVLATRSVEMSVENIGLYTLCIIVSNSTQIHHDHFISQCIRSLCTGPACLHCSFNIYCVAQQNIDLLAVGLTSTQFLG